MDVRKNRTNLEYTKKEFIIENNKTICNLTFKIKFTNPPISFFNIPYNDFKKICEHGDLVGFNPFVTEDYVEFQTSAQASVSPNDNYDAVFGERLSLTRAQAKAYMIAQMFYAHVVTYFDEKAVAIQDLMNNSYDSWRKCLNHANELEQRKYGE